jgi:hypothetical protein
MDATERLNISKNEYRHEVRKSLIMRKIASPLRKPLPFQRTMSDTRNFEHQHVEKSLIVFKLIEIEIEIE